MLACHEKPRAEHRYDAPKRKATICAASMQHNGTLTYEHPRGIPFTEQNAALSEYAHRVLGVPRGSHVCIPTECRSAWRQRCLRQRRVVLGNE